MASLRVLHLYRQDFKALSDGLTAFDDILNRFGIPQEKWLSITELELWYDNNHLLAWNDGGTRITVGK